MVKPPTMPNRLTPVLSRLTSRTSARRAYACSGTIVHKVARARDSRANRTAKTIAPGVVMALIQGGGRSCMEVVLSPAADRGGTRSAGLTHTQRVGKAQQAPSNLQGQPSESS